MRYKHTTNIDRALDHLANAKAHINMHIDSIDQEVLKQAIRGATEERLDCLIGYLAGMQFAQRMAQGGLDI